MKVERLVRWAVKPEETHAFSVLARRGKLFISLGNRGIHPLLAQRIASRIGVDYNTVVRGRYAEGYYDSREKELVFTSAPTPKRGQEKAALMVFAAAFGYFPEKMRKRITVYDKLGENQGSLHDFLKKTLSVADQIL